jgi:hypothetical protein
MTARFREKGWHLTNACSGRWRPAGVEAREALQVPDGRRQPQGRVIHQLAFNLPAFPWNSRRGGRQVPDPFVVDLICRACFDQMVHGSLNDDIAGWKG